MLRLYTFNISHFSEKARWALDYEGIAYEEKVLVPGPHQFVTRRLAPKTHVPILVHEGQVVQESSAILDYLADRLGGAKLAPKRDAEMRKARELEKEVDIAFGLGAQCIFYSVALADRSMMTDLWSFGGPFWARGFYAVAYPAIAAAVKRLYNTQDPRRVSESKDRFLRNFDHLDAVLEKQPYIAGEAPTRSDITVAALLAPLCRPPEHRMHWPEPPEGLRDFVTQLQGRPTWKHVLRMYREHRKPAH